MWPRLSASHLSWMRRTRPERFQSCHSLRFPSELPHLRRFMPFLIPHNCKPHYPLPTRGLFASADPMDSSSGALYLDSPCHCMLCRARNVHRPTPELAPFGCLSQTRKPLLDCCSPLQHHPFALILMSPSRNNRSYAGRLGESRREH